MPPENDDLSRIEVELALMSGQDSAAAVDLAASLKEIAGAFQALKEWDPAEQARKMRDVVTEAREQSRQTQENAGGSPFRSEGPPEYDTGVAAQRVQEARGAEILREFGLNQAPTGGPTSTDQAATEVQQAYDRAELERERLEQRRQQSEAEAQSARARLSDSARGTIGNLFSRPDYITDEMHALDQESDFIGHNGQFTIPRWGNLNIQDFFNAGRIYNMRKAQRLRESQAYEGLSADQVSDLRGNLSPSELNDALGFENQDSPEISQAEGRSSMWERGATAVGLRNAVRSFYRQGREVLARNDLDPGQMMARGGSLGFDRSGGNVTIPGTGIGVQTFFSEAGAEGLRESYDTITNRLRPGINQQQSEAITQASVEAGLSGELGSDYRNQFLVPAVQRYGIDPRALAPLSQVLRTGTGNIRQLSQAIDNLGSTARSANLTTETLVQGLTAAGEAAQSTGGTFLRGWQFGEQFAAATGLPPEVGVAASQNGIVQGMLGANSGVPGFLQGALPAGQRVQAIGQTAQMLFRSYMGSVGGGSNYRIMDPTHPGQVLAQDHTSGRELAIGGVASTLGISTDAASALINRTGAYAASDATSVLRMWANRAENFKNTDHETRRALTSAEVNQRLGQWVNFTYGGAPGGIQTDAQGRRFVQNYGDEHRTYIDNAIAQQRRSLASQWITSSHEDVSSWDRFQHDDPNHPERASFDDVRKMVRRVWGVTGSGSKVDQSRRDAADKVLEDAADEAHKNPEKFRKLVTEKITQKAAEQNQAQMKVAFTGPAAKLFKAIIAHDGRWNDMDWSKASNLPAGTSTGPSPLAPNPANNMGFTPGDLPGGGY